MLQTFLNGPVAVSQQPTNEAYELAWRPLGAKPLTLIQVKQKKSKAR